MNQLTLEKAMRFLSDNASGVSPRIIASVVKACEAGSRPYGADPDTKRAEDLLRQTFECDLSAFLVTTGTAANALALGAAAAGWSAILCHERGHVMCDECGAPEMFTGGAKLIGLGGAKGKISVGTLNECLANLQASPCQHLRPSVLSLAQANEFGAVYTPDEIRALTSRAHDEGMVVHMDGARFANAVVSLSESPAGLSWRSGIDILSLGASKNGGIACEAVIFFNKALAREFHQRRKRAGHTVAKGRFLGSQMCAYLSDGHWLETATIANHRAARLADGLSRAPGVRLPWAREANIVFAIMPRQLLQILSASGAEYYEWPHYSLGCTVAPTERLVRLVTSFATTIDEVDHFVSIVIASQNDLVKGGGGWRADRAAAEKR